MRLESRVRLVAWVGLGRPVGLAPQALQRTPEPPGQAVLRDCREAQPGQREQADRRDWVRWGQRVRVRPGQADRQAWGQQDRQDVRGQPDPWGQALPDLRVGLAVLVLLVLRVRRVRKVQQEYLVALDRLDQQETLALLDLPALRADLVQPDQRALQVDWVQLDQPAIPVHRVRLARRRR